MSEREKNLGVISLGCDKNRVDTENALAYFAERGYTPVSDLAQADAILVNTCGFIDPAKQESIDAILEAASYKSGRCRALIVSGCLAQRYGAELKEGIPEIEVLAGTDRYADLPAAADRVLAGGAAEMLFNDINDRHFTSKRILTTPAHYAYLKIAEGCSNRCTYCAIPYIRGNYTSRPLEELAAEAKELAEGWGVKELILVAQDVTRYGTDKGKKMLIPLLEELSKLDFERIRLLYLYPEQVDDELIEYIAKNEKICKYVDIPLQHINDKILKKMGRRVNGAQIRGLVKKLREKGIFVRSTFIAGFPGEGEEEFEELLAFLEEAHFYACGFFAYSKEEGTPAAKLPEQVAERVKAARVKKAYAVQNAISSRDKQALIGRVFDVVYEDIDYDRQAFAGRTEFQTPDVDGVTYFKSDIPVDVGGVYRVKITGVCGEDLIGEVTE